MKFGSHTSTAGGVWKALERGESVGCECVQLFVKNNMQWFGRPFAPDDLARYANQLARRKFSSVFGHAGYLINLGAPPSSPHRENSLKSLKQEIRLATDLGLPFLVLHPGAHLGHGDDAGLKQIVAGLDEVIRETRECPVRIALEVTAGQGTCLGWRIEHLAAQEFDGPVSRLRSGALVRSWPVPPFRNLLSAPLYRAADRSRVSPDAATHHAVTWRGPPAIGLRGVVLVRIRGTWHLFTR